MTLLTPADPTMTRATIAGGTFVAALVLLLLVFVVRDPALKQGAEPTAASAATIIPSGPAAEAPGFLYGRITTVDAVTYEGRLRWGVGDQEAFWGDYFDGTKAGNRWAVHAPRQRDSLSIEILGRKIGGEDFPRPFMARFGDIARLEAHFGDVQVTLKSGTMLTLDRFSAGDIDDGVRVWDGRRGVVDLDARRIRTIEFLPTAPLVAAPDRLHGTVRTRQGDFTGFIQWDREDCFGADALDGRTADGPLSLRYDSIRSIARRSRDSALVSLADGREMMLSNTSDVSQGNRGIAVDDRRYGRVLIPWDAFERVDFSRGGSGPGYGEFAAGRPLVASVTTRDGRRLAGRLVYDFDESETTETLDAKFQDVDYFIPLGLIASIVPHGRDGRGATVVLHDGEELPFDRTGDLAERNAGMLIFVDGRERPEHVAWTDVKQIDFERAPAMSPPR